MKIIDYMIINENSFIVMLPGLLKKLIQVIIEDDVRMHVSHFIVA